MISADQLQQVGAATQLNASAASLRLKFPDLHFTECSEDDVSPLYRPVVHLDGYNLYLISGSSGHCLALTNTPENATGILVAAKVDDE